MTCWTQDLEERQYVMKLLYITKLQNGSTTATLDYRKSQAEVEMEQSVSSWQAPNYTLFVGGTRGQQKLCHSHQEQVTGIRVQIYGSLSQAHVLQLSWQQLQGQGSDCSLDKWHRSVYYCSNMKQQLVPTPLFQFYFSNCTGTYYLVSLLSL